jgi:hypothetical protein
VLIWIWYPTKRLRSLTFTARLFGWVWKFSVIFESIKSSFAMHNDLVFRKSFRYRTYKKLGRRSGKALACPTVLSSRRQLCRARRYRTEARPTPLRYRQIFREKSNRLMGSAFQTVAHMDVRAIA